MRWRVHFYRHDEGNARERPLVRREVEQPSALHAARWVVAALERTSPATLARVSSFRVALVREPAALVEAGSAVLQEVGR